MGIRRHVVGKVKSLKFFSSYCYFSFCRSLAVFFCHKKMNSLHLHRIYSDIMFVDIKDDFQSILRSLSTLLIINIIPVVPTHGMRINVSCFQTLNLLHVSFCKMFPFWDVSHETKQKKKLKQTSESVQSGREIIFNCYVKHTVFQECSSRKSVSFGDRLCPRTSMQAFFCPNGGW